MHRLISLVFLSFAFISCQTKSEKQSDDLITLSSKIDSIIVEHKFNGVILVSSDSAIVYSKAVGFADLESRTQMSLNDLFVIGSISKQITAVLVLRAYERGTIKLDDTIAQYLTQINQPWVKKVTIHHLLTHTHGIIDLNQPLEFEQGSQFHYSQLGYEVLAQILEKVSNDTFKNLSTALFEQYELKNTFHPDSHVYENLVKGYVERENDTLAFAENSLANYAPAGSFISNATDLVKWNDLLYTGKLVNPETLNLMRTKYATRSHPIFETVEYGYGLLFKDGEQHIQIGALGYAPGFVSACYHYPKSNSNLVILENIAYDLHDFRQTFSVHTELMELIKQRSN